MKHIALILALSLPLLGGCDKIQTASTGTVTQVAPSTMLTAKKSLIAAHALHQAAAESLTAAANANLCKARCAVDAKRLLNQSADGLKAADNLVALGDAEGVQAKIGGATALISQVQALIGRE